MLKVVLPTAVLALAAGTLAGHFLWPVRQSAQQDAARHSRWAPAVPLNPDGTPSEAPPEIWTADKVMQAVRDLANIKSASQRAEAAMAIVPHIESADAPELAPKLAPLAHERAVQQLLMNVLAMWSEGDPEAAVRFAAKLGDQSLQIVAVSSTIHAWVEADADAALKFVETMPQGALRNQCAEMILSSAAMVDPQRALKLAGTLPAGNAQAETGAVFAVWAQNDVEGALAAATALTDPRAKKQAIESVMSDWAQKDATAALDWMVKHHSEPGMADALQNAFGTAAVERPDLAASYLAKIDDGPTRDGIIGTLAIRWGNDDLDAAKKWVASLDDNDRTLALEGLVSGTHYDNPANALELAKAIEDPKRRGRSIATVLSSWADREPEAAMKVAQELPPGREKDQVISNVVGSLARTNPIAAAEALTEMEEGPAVDRAAGDIARAWADIDPQAAMRWVERLPTGDGKDYALSSIVTSWVQNDPEAATAWADSHGTAGTKRDLAVMWATTDPQAAADWAMSFRNDPGDTFANVVGTWAANDSRRAAAWVEQLPRGQRRDSAFAQLGEGSLYDDPQAAMAYVEQIADPKARSTARSRLFGNWAAQEPKEAERWKASARLSPAELASLDQPASEVAPETNSACVCPPVDGAGTGP